MKKVRFNKIVLVIIIFACFVFSSCTIKQKPKAYEKIYADDVANDVVMDEEIGAEDMSDVSKYIKEIKYSKIQIPTKEELEKNKTLEDKMWESLVENTVYIRMPVGYEDDFSLRKYISVDYIYNMYINGLKGISWETECEMVKEFLVKRIFEHNGLSSNGE